MNQTIFSRSPGGNCSGLTSSGFVDCSPLASAAGASGSGLIFNGKTNDAYIKLSKEKAAKPVKDHAIMEIGDTWQSCSGLQMHFKARYRQCGLELRASRDYQKVLASLCQETSRPRLTTELIKAKKGGPRRKPPLRQH